MQLFLQQADMLELVARLPSSGSGVCVRVCICVRLYGVGFPLISNLLSPHPHSAY